jgi:hypothetical protein
MDHRQAVGGEDDGVSSSLIGHAPEVVSMPSTTAPDSPTLVLDPTDHAPLLARRFLAEWFAKWGIADDYLGRLVGQPVIEVWDAAPLR